MLQKVLDNINMHSMFQNGDKVIVALSGGPDSMCLVHVLGSIKDKLGISLYAVHVNHCLRGREADEDEEYVRNFCFKNNIEFFSKRVDINKLSSDKGISSETAGREARYEFFLEVKEKIGANKIALAHNLNDQAETLLMRIMRGTGIEGLNGIKPVRDEIYVRPILVLSREEIENYCYANNLNPRIDRTNYENIYNRNKIRLELIPYIQENFNKDIINTLNRFSNIISKDNDFIESIAGESFNCYCEVNENKVIMHNKVGALQEAVSSRVIRRAIQQVQGSLNNIEMVHIYDIIRLFKAGTGKSINLPRDVVCENVYGNVHIFVRKSELKDNIDELKLIQKNKIDNKVNLSVEVKKFGLCVNFSVKNYVEKANFNNESLTKYFDYDKIKSSITIRYRKEGDRFAPFGMNGSKKLKDLFIDLKIPKENRNKIPLICFDDEIAWIVGYRISSKFMVTKDTKNILEIKLEKSIQEI